MSEAKCDYACGMDSDYFSQEEASALVGVRVKYMDEEETVIDGVVSHCRMKEPYARQDTEKCGCWYVTAPLPWGQAIINKRGFNDFYKRVYGENSRNH